MITEAQALAALPDRGWLREYVDYATSITDSNAAYHIAAGLAVLAQTVPISFIIPDGKIRANFYGLIVGSSTRSRKTTAVNIAQSILTMALPERVMAQPGSEQRFVDSLVENPQQIWCVGEGGAFFSSMQSGYLRVMKDRITEVYDCRRLARETVSAKNKRVFQDNPRFSLLVAINDAYLEDNTRDEDWVSGMLARFFTIYANRERDRKRVGSNKDEETRLATALKDLAAFSNVGDPFANPQPECLGFDAEAEAMWAEWYDRANGATGARTIQAAVDRAQDMAWKIAGLLAWDYGAARSGQNWYITAEVLKPALRITDLHIASVMKIGTTLSSDRDMRIMRRVLEAIDTTPTPESIIYRKAQVTIRVGEIMLRTLALQKRIALSEANGSERRFHRVIDVDGSIPSPIDSPQLKIVFGGGDPFAESRPPMNLDDLFKT